jgi:hypothetical protein
MELIQSVKPEPPYTIRVGAAAGCDLLTLILKTRSKDRSLRQLLHRNVGFEEVMTN